MAEFPIQCAGLGDILQGYLKIMFYSTYFIRNDKSAKKGAFILN